MVECARAFNLQLTRFLQGLVRVPHEQLAEQGTPADLQGHTVRHWHLALHVQGGTPVS